MLCLLLCGDVMWISFVMVCEMLCVMVVNVVVNDFKLLGGFGD